MPSGQPSRYLYLCHGIGPAPLGAAYAYLAAIPFFKIHIPQEECGFIYPSIFKESNITFKPYTPPNEGAGLLSVDRDLCWRINPRGLVTPAVIGAVCWARNNFGMSDAQHLAVLDGLGLEYHRLIDGATILRPKDCYRVAPCSGSRKPHSEGGEPRTEVFSLTNPVLPLASYDAIEVYPCIEDESGIQRFEVNEHVPAMTPHFWSVALHLEEGGIETIADFHTESQAQTFGELMRSVVLADRQAAGLDSHHILSLSS